MGGEGAGMFFFVVGEVFFGVSVGDSEVGFFSEEGEVGDRIHFSPFVPFRIQLRFWENVMHFQAREPAEHVLGQGAHRLPSRGLRRLG